MVQEDPVEEEMATHSSILAWVIPWTEEPGGLQFMGVTEAGTTWRLNSNKTANSKLPVHPSPTPFPFGNKSVFRACESVSVSQRSPSASISDPHICGLK